MVAKRRVENILGPRLDAGEDATAALKGERRLYVPEENRFRAAPVYDGHATRFGHRIEGPALIEQVNTAILVSAGFDCVCDRHGSFAIHAKSREEPARDAARPSAKTR